MGEILEEICVSLYNGDFLSRFDLVAGTSIGGVAALAFSDGETT